jgi:O-phosphoseryl-tRNA(Cys) synthetase
MTFDAKKFGQVAMMLGPQVLLLAGVPAAIVGMITQEIVIAQSIKGASGAEKKAKVLDAVKNGAALTDALVHPDVNDVDEDQLTETVSNGIDAVISTINTVKNIPVKSAA